MPNGDSSSTTQSRHHLNEMALAVRIGTFLTLAVITLVLVQAVTGLGYLPSTFLGMIKHICLLLLLAWLLAAKLAIIIAELHKFWNKRKSHE